MKYLNKSLQVIKRKRLIKKLYQFILSSLLVTSLYGCSFQNGSNVPHDIKPWRVGVINPQHYQTNVDLIYGINIRSGWRVVINDVYRGDSVGARSRSDKFSLHLNPNLIELKEQLVPTVRLPEHVVIKWESRLEGEFYYAKFEITEKVRVAMLKSRLWIDGETCYQNDIVFGLLPGGDAKVWLFGCNRYTFVERIESSGGSLSYPDNVIFRKRIDRDSRQIIERTELLPYENHISETDQVIKYTGYDELTK